MKKILLLSLFFRISLTFAEDGGLLFDDFDQRTRDLKASSWIVFINSEVMQFKPLQSFSLENKEIKAREKNYNGGGVGIGRKWWLGSYFNTTTEIALFFVQNRNEENKIPSEDTISTYVVSNFKELHIHYGSRLSQSIGIGIELPGFILEPFAQIYIGLGFNDSKVGYYWDTQIASEYESYNSKITENTLYQGVGAGFNILIDSGLMTYVKVMKNTITVGKRKTSTQISTSGTVVEDLSNSQNINETIDKYSLGIGLGYLF